MSYARMFKGPWSNVTLGMYYAPFYSPTNNSIWLLDMYSKGMRMEIKALIESHQGEGEREGTRGGGGKREKKKKKTGHFAIKDVCVRAYLSMLAIAW